jgi:hypothetical protein
LAEVWPSRASSSRMRSCRAAFSTRRAAFSAHRAAFSRQSVASSPAGARGQAPAPAAQAKAAAVSRSCRRSTPSEAAGQGRGRPLKTGGLNSYRDLSPLLLPRVTHRCGACYATLGMPSRAAAGGRRAWKRYPTRSRQTSRAWTRPRSVDGAIRGAPRCRRASPNDWGAGSTPATAGSTCSRTPSWSPSRCETNRKTQRELIGG